VAIALEATRSAWRKSALLDQAILFTCAPLETTLSGRPRPLSADRRAFRAAALAMQRPKFAARPAAKKGCETGAADGGPMARSDTMSFFSIVPVPV